MSFFSEESDTIRFTTSAPNLLPLKHAATLLSNGKRQTLVFKEFSSEPVAEVLQEAPFFANVMFISTKVENAAVIHFNQLTLLAFPASKVRLPGMELQFFEDKSLSAAPLNTCLNTSKKVLSPSTPTVSAVQKVTSQAMILGAGLASRFIPVSGDITGYPKPAVPLIGETSVIGCLATQLYLHGIRHIVVNTYYKPAVVKAELNHLSATLADLKFSFVDEKAPSGTAGGLVKALEENLIDREQPVLVMQGDAVTDADLSCFLNAHHKYQRLATIAIKKVSEEAISQVAIVQTDGSGEDGESGQVQKYQEKPTLAQAGQNRWGSIGFYVFSPEFYSRFVNMGHQCWQQRAEFDYAKDCFPQILSQPSSSPASDIWAQVLPEPYYWSDIGQPRHYFSTVKEIASGTTKLVLPPDIKQYYSENGVIFWDSAQSAVKNAKIKLEGNVIVFLNK